MKDYPSKLLTLLAQRHWMIATAESCTGGLIAKVFTDIAGSSGWFERGFVTYSNEAKHECLGVPKKTLEAYGAVSEPTALAMVQGALNHSHAQCAIATTGIAGPSGGTQEKPVGTVWIAWATIENQAIAKCYHFNGDRTSVRQQTVDEAILKMIELLEKPN